MSLGLEQTEERIKAIRKGPISICTILRDDTKGEERGQAGNQPKKTHNTIYSDQSKKKEYWILAEWEEGWLKCGGK